MVVVMMMVVVVMVMDVSRIRFVGMLVMNEMNLS